MVVKKRRKSYFGELGNWQSAKVGIAVSGYFVEGWPWADLHSQDNSLGRSPYLKNSPHGACMTLPDLLDFHIPYPGFYDGHHVHLAGHDGLDRTVRGKSQVGFGYTATAEWEEEGAEGEKRSPGSSS